MKKTVDNKIFSKFSNDNEDILMMSKFMDKYEKCQRNNILTHTKFHDLRQITLCMSIINAQKLNNVHVFGGINEAERSVLVCLPDYMYIDDLLQNDEVICAIRIKNLSKIELSHRDFLGSILGLMIERTLIGDICVHEEGADVLVLAEIADFLELNLVKVGKVPVQVSKISLDEVKLPMPEFRTIKGTISTPRVDAVLALGFGLSRTECTKYIARGIVLVNHKPCTKNDFEIHEGDKISMRGFGKIHITEFSGKSRKGRLFIEILKFI